MKRIKESLCVLWDTIKKNYLIVEYRKGKKGRNGQKKLFFSNLRKDLDIQVHKAHKSPKESTQKVFSKADCNKGV